MAKRGPKIKFTGKDGARHQFSMPFLEAIARDLKKKGDGVATRTVIDDIQTGLRAVVRASGISWHVSFMLEQGKGRANERPYQKIGTADDLTIEQARHLASVIRELGAKGIDIRQGPRTDKLRGELLTWGTRWRPDVTGAPETLLPLDLGTTKLESFAETLKNQPDTQLVLEDTALPGLRAVLRLGEPTKFRIGKTTLLGTYPDISVEEARTRAKAILSLIEQGVTIGE
jgi:hypothetical protein